MNVDGIYHRDEMLLLIHPHVIPTPQIYLPSLGLSCKRLRKHNNSTCPSMSERAWRFVEPLASRLASGLVQAGRHLISFAFEERGAPPHSTCLDGRTRRPSRARPEVTSTSCSLSPGFAHREPGVPSLSPFHSVLKTNKIPKDCLSPFSFHQRVVRRKRAAV